MDGRALGAWSRGLVWGITESYLGGLVEWAQKFGGSSVFVF